jgi:predicted CopG family antitoxin
MAVKTITIDMAAYEALARRKRQGQSFSDVIKEHFTRGGTGRDLLEAARQFAPSEDALDAIDGVVAERRRHRVRAPQL